MASNFAEVAPNGSPPKPSHRTVLRLLGPPSTAQNSAHTSQESQSARYAAAGELVDVWLQAHLQDPTYLTDLPSGDVAYQQEQSWKRMAQSYTAYRGSLAAMRERFYVSDAQEHQASLLLMFGIFAASERHIGLLGGNISQAQKTDSRQTDPKPIELSRLPESLEGFIEIYGTEYGGDFAAIRELVITDLLCREHPHDLVVAPGGARNQTTIGRASVVLSGALSVQAAITQSS